METYIELIDERATAIVAEAFERVHAFVEQFPAVGISDVLFDVAAKLRKPEPERGSCTLSAEWYDKVAAQFCKACKLCKPEPQAATRLVVTYTQTEDEPRYPKNDESYLTDGGDFRKAKGDYQHNKYLIFSRTETTPDEPPKLPTVEQITFTFTEVRSVRHSEWYKGTCGTMLQWPSPHPSHDEFPIYLRKVTLVGKE